MRLQPITRVVNAMAAQGRVIIWLACQHKVTITQMQMMSHPDIKGELYLAERDKQFMCPFCPDPPPEVVRDKKTPQQLYKEAGEP